MYEGYSYDGTLALTVQFSNSKVKNTRRVRKMFIETPCPHHSKVNHLWVIQGSRSHFDVVNLIYCLLVTDVEMVT